MTTIYYEVDGEPVPARECMWALVAPCGCECGWSVAGSEYAVDEDQAWDSFSRTKARRGRDEKLGFRVEIKRRTDIRIDDECTHTPRFGVPPRPEIDGHTWAVKHEGRVLHSVPLVIERDSYVIRRRPEHVSSLCGRAEGGSWSTELHLIDGLVECAGCLKVAHERTWVAS
ncbi:hypothetical protein [Nocardia wallacei]|uniref:hypothetical protein n=1 Tax=Nocardia wallacei TaxID=480035 RepID=UPI002457B9F3|nr:hypothetical protein [Nocardia wallacei]